MVDTGLVVHEVPWRTARENGSVATCLVLVCNDVHDGVSYDMGGG